MIGIAHRVALYVSLILLALIATQTAIFSKQSESTLEELIGERLESIAVTAALMIDGDAHERIRTKADGAGGDYAALRDVLALVAESTRVKPHLVYTLRPSGDVMEFVVIAETGRNDVGDVYRQIPPELRQVLESGKPAHRGRYDTENGTWISGFAPIKTRLGETVALLEVDYEISEFIAARRSELVQSIAVAGAVLLVGVVLVFFAVRATTKRIVRLTDLADSISRGEVEKQVPAMGVDEVGRLAKALERLRESVRTSLDLLKSS